jgi:hypothetical protein
MRNAGVKCTSFDCAARAKRRKSYNEWRERHCVWKYAGATRNEPCLFMRRASLLYSFTRRSRYRCVREPRDRTAVVNCLQASSRNRRGNHIPSDDAMPEQPDTAGRRSDWFRRCKAAATGDWPPSETPCTHSRDRADVWTDGGKETRRKAIVFNWKVHCVCAPTPSSRSDCTSCSRLI